ncbi:hypothetical protein COY28_02515, partial [Candidatus Woesearchaeota archaeon CG_4_10_14_0_2_um_filter_57_5]
DLILLLHFDNLSEYGENGTRYHDFSPLGIEAQCTNNTCPVLEQEGKFGSAITLNASVGGINCSNEAERQPSAFTVAAWIRTTHAYSANPLISWAPAGIAYPAVYLPWGGTGPMIYMGYSDPHSNYRTFSWPLNLYNGDWHHVVFTLAGNGTADINTGRFFVDGNEYQAKTTNANTPMHVKQNCFVGASHGDLVSWNGTI